MKIDESCINHNAVRLIGEWKCWLDWLKQEASE